ncbi:MAG: hypothetical protein B7733_14230 [Myxococcales bacterium FL481]|nr:MAG: hypothetical protein B7733_14230 [Myxococcales bacterium FL481]
MFAPWLAIAAWFSRVAWFMCDDAFISFRYVRNLVEGHGLVFNRGEYVEGYTNFLWVLELAGLWSLFGARPEVTAPALSSVYTVGTLALLLWWVAHSPGTTQRTFVAWMAAGLLCTNASFAVWTSSGLETRQFTFYVVAAVVCLAVHGERQSGRIIASLSLAAMAYTRPEGLLLAACCFAYDAGRQLVAQRSIDRRQIIALVAPFMLLVVGHFVFRYFYYGEWLPNTYYAKHIRPWYESGFRYLLAAALETGLYLLLPLSWLALRVRWRRYGESIHALVLLMVLAHLTYLLRIGGDHFEWRPLDFYWPLLAVPAAQGIAHLGVKVSERLEGWRSGEIRMPPRGAALALFGVVLVYSNAVQAVLLFEGAERQGRGQTHKLHLELDRENARWLLRVPLMPVIVAISNDLRRQSIAQLVGARFVEHREFAKMLRGQWGRYEEGERGVIPNDAVMSLAAVGVVPFYAPDLAVVDFFGLTDATVARAPVTTPNHLREIAHDRRPPPGYFQQRGVNFLLRAPASSADEALTQGNYALEIGPELWMPFDVGDHQWANERFADRDLRAVHRFDLENPAGNRFRMGDTGYVGRRFLGRFEAGFDGWTRKDAAVTNRRDHPLYAGQNPIYGYVGAGVLTSYHPEDGDRAVGSARSPEFRAQASDALAFLIAGGKSRKMGLRLVADGRDVKTWRGEDAEDFRLVVYPLKAVAAKKLQLELFDREPGAWGHLLVDHVMLVRAEPG